MTFIIIRVNDNKLYQTNYYFNYNHQYSLYFVIAYESGPIIPCAYGSN